MVGQWVEGVYKLLALINNSKSAKGTYNPWTFKWALKERE
jgi:hypothetical protein